MGSKKTFIPTVSSRPPVYFEHPLVRPGSIELRDYQVNIAKTAMKEPTLVVLPTGMGKTIVALMLVADALSRSSGKVLFMAPTKPLVEQHAGFLRTHLVGAEPQMFTGEVAPGKRSEAWDGARLVVSTPQVIENDLGEGRISLRDVVLIVFDEAHRAVGDYAYVSIAKKYAETGGIALGMTASPGSDVAKIAEVCENLGITNVEIRSELDGDVVKYVQDVKTEFIGVGMPEGMARVIYLLQKIMDEQVAKLRAQGFMDPDKPPTTRDFLQAGNIIRARLNSGTKNFHLYRAASIQATAMKVNHGIELAQTQGRSALESYFTKLAKEGSDKEGSKASRDLVKDARFQQARTLLYSMEEDHPKLEKVEPILKQQFLAKPDSRVIVFTHYRDTCETLTQRLEKIPGLRPVRFVGQASKGTDTGLNQREQKDIIDKFRAGDYNVLVSTSIAEEGLDIPATDLVVFFEPVPSEIRTIQRRGRTGRKQAGRVIVLVTRDTRDEAYLWTSRKKEMQMRRELDALRRKLRMRKGVQDEHPRVEKTLTKENIEEMMAPPTDKEERALRASETKGQRSLGQFKKQASGGGTAVTVSDRVAGSGLARELEGRGLLPEPADLEDADVIVSDRVAVAVRSVDTFIRGIGEGNLMPSMMRLKQQFQRPVLIVQGQPEGKGDAAVNSAVFDVLSAMLSELQMPVLSTGGPAETATAIDSLRRQEDEKGGKPGRAVQTTLDTSRRQLFLVQGLPNVSATLAQRLLTRFGSVERMADASTDELMQVDGIGRVIAEGIHTILRKKFGEEE